MWYVVLALVIIVLIIVYVKLAPPTLMEAALASKAKTDAANAAARKVAFSELIKPEARTVGWGLQAVDGGYYVVSSAMIAGRVIAYGGMTDTCQLRSKTDATQLAMLLNRRGADGKIPQRWVGPRTVVEYDAATGKCTKYTGTD